MSSPRSCEEDTYDISLVENSCLGAWHLWCFEHNVAPPWVLQGFCLDPHNFPEGARRPFCGPSRGPVLTAELRSTARAISTARDRLSICRARKLERASHTTYLEDWWFSQECWEKICTPAASGIVGGPTTPPPRPPSATPSVSGFPVGILVGVQRPPKRHRGQVVVGAAWGVSTPTGVARCMPEGRRLGDGDMHDTIRWPGGFEGAGTGPDEPGRIIRIQGELNHPR